ncbi:LysM peptidoglycan-binding domain-containing protein [Pseudomonadota bacterium]
MTIDVRWKDTMAIAISDARWDAYDAIIEGEIAAYKNRFKTTLTEDVDALLIKAMLWAESGGPDNIAWTTRPLHIGSGGDPAYQILKTGAEGSDFIMSTDLANLMKGGSINDPKTNIKAGIAYLYTRMATTNIVSVRDLKDANEYVYVVQPGEDLNIISQNVGTTVFELKRLNPTASSFIHSNQTLKYVKAEMQRSVSGWLRFTIDNIADRYNGGRDPEYVAKLEYLIKNIIPNLVRTQKL